MARQSSVLIDLPDFVISSGQTQATTDLAADVFAKYDAIGIVAPATLTGTVTIRAYDSDGPGGTPVTVQSPPGTDITVPQGKCVVLTSLPFPRFTLVSSGAEGAGRTFKVFAQKQVVYNNL